MAQTKRRASKRGKKKTGKKRSGGGKSWGWGWLVAIVVFYLLSQAHPH